MDTDTAFVLLDRGAMTVGVEPVASGARNERIEQDHLQIAAMDRELRMLIARGAAERLPVDQLAEAVEEGRILRGDRDLRQVSFESEGCKFFGGMREQIDADPDRPDFPGRLEYPAGNSGGVQLKPERQSANAGADDNDVVHVSFRHLLFKRLP